jgi:hypothetical protein
MALEETPWLRESRGGAPAARDLVKVLDPRIARATRDTALAKLEQAQLPSGAFPSWPGGPPSDFMTLNMLYGFAKAGEFQVEVPSRWCARAGNTWARYASGGSARSARDGCCVELLTFLTSSPPIRIRRGWATFYARRARADPGLTSPAGRSCRLPQGHAGAHPASHGAAAN